MLSLAGWNSIVKNFGLQPHGLMMVMMLALTLGVNFLLSKRKSSALNSKLEAALSLVFVGAGQFATKKFKRGLIFYFCTAIGYIWMLLRPEQDTIFWMVLFGLLGSPIESYMNGQRSPRRSVGRSKLFSGSGRDSQRKYDELDQLMEMQARLQFQEEVDRINQMNQADFDRANQMVQAEFDRANHTFHDDFDRFNDSVNDSFNDSMHDSMDDYHHNHW